MSINIKNYNDNGQMHGYQERYWVNGNLWYKCFYYNDTEIDYEEFYYDECGLEKRFYI